MEKYNVPVAEMEIAGIYGAAAEYGAAAVAMCTVSDDILSGKGLTVEERQNSFDEMTQTGAHRRYRTRPVMLHDCRSRFYPYLGVILCCFLVSFPAYSRVAAEQVIAGISQERIKLKNSSGSSHPSMYIGLYRQSHL